MKLLIVVIAFFLTPLLYGQPLNGRSIEHLNISQGSKTILANIIEILNQVPDKQRYSDAEMDSIRAFACIFNMPPVDTLRKSVSIEELEKMIASPVPVVHLLGFWFYCERSQDKRAIVSNLKKITELSEEPFDLGLKIYCDPYGFSFWKGANYFFTPYLCFDIISHKYPVWKSCTLVTGKYRKKAKRILRRYRDELESKTVIIH